MLHSTSHFDSERKKQIEGELVTRILTALERSEINLSQMKEISTFILDRIETVHDETHFVLFLDLLVGKWEIFKDIHLIYKNKVNAEKEKDIIKTLSHLANRNKTN